ncbi:MAG TPA: hypothetical protein VGO86_11090 [Candidatus Dormibacteraeota bacterium]
MNYYVFESEMRWRQAQLQRDVERSRLAVEAASRRSRGLRPALVVPRATRLVVTRLRHSLARRPGDRMSTPDRRAPMYAVVRRYTYDLKATTQAAEAFAAAQALHAKQPGYAGGVVVDDGLHFIAVNLWETERAAAAGRSAIGPQVQRLLERLMATGSELLGAGEVVADDLWHRPTG